VAERRYENWQKDRLKGFEKEEKSKTARKTEREDVENNKRRASLNYPTPSTSSGFNRAQSADPLAKARFEWNKALKAEYLAKFQKWTDQKKGMFQNIFIKFCLKLLC